MTMLKAITSVCSIQQPLQMVQRKSMIDDLRKILKNAEPKQVCICGVNCVYVYELVRLYGTAIVLAVTSLKTQWDLMFV